MNSRQGYRVRALMQRLGDWSFDATSARLRRGEEVQRLDPKEVAVLLHLAEEAPNPVSVESLLDHGWPGLVVGDNAVHQVVARLRKALGDDARRPSYIETLPRRGYRLMVVPGVVEDSDGSASPPPRAWPSWRLYAILLATLAVVAGLSLWSTARAPLQQVVVQPFTIPDPGLLHLASGFEDELVHAISRNPALIVIGPRESMSAEPSGLVVSGGLRPTMQNEARASFRLATSGRTIWTRNIDVDLEHPFTDQVAIADQLSVTITIASDLLRSLRGGTTSDRALVAVLRASLLAGSNTTEGAMESLAYYDQAIRLDPEFASPYALKAMTYRTLANWYRMDAREAVERMRGLVDQALGRDPDLPLALLASVAIKLYDGAYDEAEQALQRALAGTTGHNLSPRPYAAILLAHCGRFDEALAILERAIESHPVHPRYLEYYQAQILSYARRFDEALAVLDQVLAVTPGDKRAREVRGHVLMSMGRHQEGVEELAWQFPELQGWMRDAYREQGIEGIGHGYLRLAGEIEQGSVAFIPKQSAWRMYVRGHAILGEAEQAVSRMDEGWSLGDRWEFFYHRVYPWPGLDELRAHPAFADLMSRTIGNPATCPGSPVMRDHHVQLAEGAGSTFR